MDIGSRHHNSYSASLLPTLTPSLEASTASARTTKTAQLTQHTAEHRRWTAAPAPK